MDVTFTLYIHQQTDKWRGTSKQKMAPKAQLFNTRRGRSNDGKSRRWIFSTIKVCEEWRPKQRQNHKGSEKWNRLFDVLQLRSRTSCFPDVCLFDGLLNSEVHNETCLCWKFGKKETSAAKLSRLLFRGCGSTGGQLRVTVCLWCHCCTVCMIWLAVWKQSVHLDAVMMFH